MGQYSNNPYERPVAPSVELFDVMGNELAHVNAVETRSKSNLPSQFAALQKQGAEQGAEAAEQRKLLETVVETGKATAKRLTLLEEATRQLTEAKAAVAAAPPRTRFFGKKRATATRCFFHVNFGAGAQKCEGTCD